MVNHCITNSSLNFNALFVDDFENALKTQKGKVGQHYCPATFREKIRQTEYVDTISKIWVDVDAPENYSGEEEAAAAWLPAIEAAGISPPCVIRSGGGGIHIVWEFARGYPLDQWQHLRDALIRWAMDKGLKADFAHTQAAAFLRTPESIHESGEPCAVIKEGAPTTLEKMIVCLVDYVAGGEKSGGIDPTPTNRFKDKEYSWPLIKERCAALKWMSEPMNKASVPEPLWRAGLSIAFRTAAGEEAVKELSAGYPDYNEHEAVAKAQKSRAPYSCAKFRECGGMCAGCAHTIRTPLQLGVEVNETPTIGKEIITADGTKGVQVGGYTISDSGIYGASKQKDEIIQICAIPVYIGDVVENTFGEATSGCYLQWTNANGVKRDEFLEYSVMSDAKSFSKWLSQRNLINKIYHPYEFYSYILKATSLIEEKSLKNGISKYGWDGEGINMPYGYVDSEGVRASYIIGDLPRKDIIHPDGKESVMDEVIKKLSSKNEGILLIPFLLGVCAPLCEMVGIVPIVLHLTGISGAGKTTAPYLAGASYGFGSKNDKFNITDSVASINPLTDKLRKMQTLMVCYDEIKGKTPQDIRNVIMQAVNGREKERMSRDGKIITRGGWFSPLVMTGNATLQNDRVDNALYQRMIEISVREKLIITQQELVRWNANLVKDGYACVQYIVKNKDEIRTLYSQFLDTIVKDSKYDGSMRFVATTAAVISCACKIVSELFPQSAEKVESVLAYFLKKYIIGKGSIESGENIKAAISEWIDENNDKIVIFSAFGGRAENEDKVKIAYARYDAANRTMYIKANIVRGILVDCNESMAAFEEYAQENFLFGGKTTRKRISTKGEACNCYAFKTGGDD